MTPAVAISLFGSAAGGRRGSRSARLRAANVDTVDQVAFRELVTCESVADAAAVFSRWGIVRVPGHLSPEEVQNLLDGAAKYGIRRDAFAQSSQLDRYTIWIAGDGMTPEQEESTTEAMKAAVPCLDKGIFHSSEDSWRSITDSFGYPNLMLAEVVTSQPSGAPQDWHFDGEGVTAQISLVPIDATNGPTEIQPRPVPRAYMHWVNRLGSRPPVPGDDAMEGLQELTEELKGMYDRLTRAHEFAWNTLRPILGNQVAVARKLIEAGLTPPVVHMTADVGTLTLYDAAMIHRGGQNMSEAERPILAVHINKEKRELRHQRRQKEGSAVAGAPAGAPPATMAPAAAAGQVDVSRVLGTKAKGASGLGQFKLKKKKQQKGKGGKKSSKSKAPSKGFS